MYPAHCSNSSLPLRPADTTSLCGFQSAHPARLGPAPSPAMPPASKQNGQKRNLLFSSDLSVLFFFFSHLSCCADTYMRVEGVSLKLGQTQELELGLTKQPTGMEGGREPRGGRRCGGTRWGTAEKARSGASPSWMGLKVRGPVELIKRGTEENRFWPEEAGPGVPEPQRTGV